MRSPVSEQQGLHTRRPALHLANINPGHLPSSMKEKCCLSTLEKLLRLKIKAHLIEESKHEISAVSKFRLDTKLTRTITEYNE